MPLSSDANLKQRRGCLGIRCGKGGGAMWNRVTDPIQNGVEPAPALGCVSNKWCLRDSQARGNQSDPSDRCALLLTLSVLGTAKADNESPSGISWYQGTADSASIRKNIESFGRIVLDLRISSRAIPKYD